MTSTNQDILIFGDEARDSIKKGADAISRAVKVTLGPKGRNVMINKIAGPPHITKDGVTVAREVRLNNVFEDMGARVVRGAAERQNEEVGDGTTTVTVLAEVIFRESLRLVASGSNPMDLKRGIEAIGMAVVDSIDQAALGIPHDNFDEIYKVAMVSANGDDEIATAIAETISAVGKEGVVTVEEAPGPETQTEIVSGIKLDSGFATPHFINKPGKGTCELENPLILIFDGNIGKQSELTPILEQVVAEGRALLVITEKIEDQIMKMLVVNKMQGNLPCCVVKAPGFASMRAELLEDVALVTGTQVTNKVSKVRLQNLTVAELGAARRVVVSRDRTVIVEGEGDAEAVEARCQELRDEIAGKTGEGKDKLEEKLAAIRGKVAILKVGAATQIEMTERKDRVDDAIHATRAAVRGGIVAGGGAALVHAAKALEDGLAEKAPLNVDQFAGINILLKALREPAMQIARNAGAQAEMVISKIEEGDLGFGYNAQTDEFGDLVASGIIDPADVVTASVRNAISIAGLLTTTEAMITEKKENTDGD